MLAPEKVHLRRPSFRRRGVHCRDGASFRAQVVAKAENRAGNGEIGIKSKTGVSPNENLDLWLLRLSRMLLPQPLQEQLPGIDPAHGLVPGTHNPYIGPAIRFEPGAPPRYIPMTNLSK